jgi:tetrahydromethanopterin S-methyltransferase subunit C
MKVISTIARILLGVIFLIFGVNLLHPFLPAVLPPGPAGEFLRGLFAAHFVYLIGAVQVIGGLLELIGQYVTLGLVFLAPVIVCIDFYHSSVAHSGLPLAALVTLLWILVAIQYRHRLAAIVTR